MTSGGFAFDDRFCKHARPQLTLGIVHLHPHARRALALVKHGIDEGCATGERFSCQAFDFHDDFLADPEVRQVSFIRVDLNPDARQVCDAIQGCTR